MSNRAFPTLEPEQFPATRDALHAYARVLGGWTSTCRPRRKHWWHASLRPSLAGLTTGVIHADVDFEIELGLRNSILSVRTATGELSRETLHGQPPKEVSAHLRDFLLSVGVPDRLVTQSGAADLPDGVFDGYSPEEANKLACVFNAVAASLTEFRANIREETSPIQLWPHHFDLAMLWLPGDKVADQDSDNEEHADKQMNFGFTFGDGGIPEPYFYVTAYPLADEFPALELPDGTQWHTEGFNGAVLTYRRLLEESDPNEYLQHLFGRLLAAGRRHLISHPN